MTYTSKKQLVDALKSQISSKASVAVRAMETIFRNQTEAEQDYGVTVEYNGVGFSSCDAELMTSLHDQYVNKGFLSGKQMDVLYKTLPKYAGQLVEGSIRNGVIRKEGSVYVW